MNLRSWSPSGEEQATAFFLSNFVLGADGPSEGHLEQITKINYEGDKHLLAAMKAVGFAGLSGYFHDSALLVDARKQYLSAIKRINLVLESRDQVKRDSTLLAVLLLVLYERVASGDKESLIDYERHAKGAGAIIKIRGREQLDSAEGIYLFIQVTTTLLSICMLKEMHMPAPILELRGDPRIRMIAANSGALRVLDTSITFVEFIASVKDGTISEPSYIVARALELDGDFRMIFSKAPTSWRYETVHDANADLRAVFNGCYHRYESIWTARMWNIFRIVRLSLHTIISDTLLRMPSPFITSLGPPDLVSEAQVQESRDIMRTMQTDILASVPEYMGRSFSSQPGLSDSHPATPGQHNSDRRGRGVSSGEHLLEEAMTASEKLSLRTKMVTRGQFIIFPLHKVGMVDLDDETAKASRLWSLQMLQYVGTVVGIRQALTFATIVKKNLE